MMSFVLRRGKIILASSVCPANSTFSGNLVRNLGEKENKTKKLVDLDVAFNRLVYRIMAPGPYETGHLRCRHR